MDATAITTRGLSRSFRFTVREPGLGAALRSLLRPTTHEVRAVEAVSFEIGAGEIMGLLGQNGAGKTTLVKMLAGLLHPSSGEVRALGHVPWRREKGFLRRIALVMGQRYRLDWHLPAAESFEMYRAIYRVPRQECRRTLSDLCDLLDLGEVVLKPVRMLSLGERMKCELATALLHTPDLLFLDEPTIGLDVEMQARIRGFLLEYNRRRGATVILTSHYMADVEALCERVLLLDRGRVLYDGDLGALSRRLGTHKTVRVEVAGPAPELGRYGEVVERTATGARLRVPRESVPEVTARLLSEHIVSDLTVEDVPLEEVVRLAFASGVSA